MTITEFLLARIAEDEERFAVSDADQEVARSGDWNEGYIVVLHERLLAEAETKRKIIRLHGDEPAWEMSSDEEYVGYDAGIGDAIRLLALAYANHPDYRPEWGLPR